MAPFIMLLVVGVLLFAMIGSTVANVANGGVVSYNETTFQEYAKKEYAKAFGSSDAIEDNILIAVLVNETSDGYYYIPWGGYNLKDEVVELFDVGADFDQAMQGTIQDYYANSLDGDLARVMRTMSRKIQNLGLDSSFYDEYSHENTPESALVNYTTLGMSEKTVNDALADFTEETGIPVVIVVETMENVFGKSMPMEDIFILVVLLGMAGIAIYLIVRAVKNRKNYDNNNQGGSDSNNGGNSGGFGNARGFDNDSRGW